MTTYVRTYEISWHEGDSDARRLADGTYRDDEALSVELIDAIKSVAMESRFDDLFPYGRNWI